MRLHFRQRLTSSYLRDMFVSAVHSNASQDQKAETAAHMSHTLTTAETHYEAHGALELTSRACKLSREHLCVDNPELNDTAGLLCSSDDDVEEDVDQNVSSPDASSEDDVSDEENIDANPDHPVNSGVQDTGVVERGRSSPRVVDSVPVPAYMSVPANVSIVSGSGSSGHVRGNKCLDEADVRLLATATVDYRSTLVMSYAPITAESVQSPACSRWTVHSPGQALPVPRQWKTVLSRPRPNHGTIGASSAWSGG